MGKVLAVVWWAWIPLCWYPLWGQTPGVGVQSGHDKKQHAPLSTNRAKNASQDQKGTRGSPLVVEVETHNRPRTPQEAADDKKGIERKDYVERWTLRATIAVAIFTGLLVLVGLGGVYAAIRTLRGIENQAKLMERQATLMQAPFDQWVELSNWRTYRPRANILPVWVDLVNNSDFPVTLNDSYLRFRHNDDSGRYTQVQLGEKVFVPPKTPFVITIHVGITDEQQQAVRSALSFQVDGRFSHLHKITKEEVVQQITGLIIFKPPLLGNDPWKAAFTPFTHMNPEIQKSQEERESEGQNQN